MASYVYNNVFLQLTDTLEFTAEPEYDPSGTDMLWTKYTIRVRGIVAEGNSRFPGVSDTTKQSGVTLNRIKVALETPRRPIRYTIGDTNLINITMGGQPENQDAQLGPHPLPATVTEPNTGTFFVECGCVVRMVNCPLTTSNGKPCLVSAILSLRWAQTETFDQSWYSRISTTGKLIVRSDLREYRSADLYRPLCTPQLLDDYQRVSSKYTLSPNGLELDFQFEDQEMDRLPPNDCVKATGTYTVVSEKPGVKRIGTVDITLEGPKGTDRKTLMVRALMMAYSKLRADKLLITVVNGAAALPILWATVKEDLFVPKVQVIVSGIMTFLTKNGQAPVPNRIALATERVAAAERLRSIVRGAASSKAGLALNLVPGGTAVVGSSLAAAELLVTVARKELADAKAAAAAAPAPGGGFLGPALGAAAAAFGASLTFQALAGGIGGVEGGAGVIIPPPDIIPSVGQQTYGLGQPQVGLATPVRGRLAALLTAAFRDPCICYEDTTQPETTMTGSPPSFLTNTEMTPTPMPGTPTAPASPDSLPLPPPGFTPYFTPSQTGSWNGSSSAPLTQNGTPATQSGYQRNARASLVVGQTNPLAGIIENVSSVVDQAPYDTYHLEKTYRYTTGKVQLPGTGVGSQGHVSAIATAHGGMGQQIVTWVAGRTGAPPVLPTAESVDTNLVLLEGQVVAEDVTMSGDGADPVYMFAGYYVYAIVDPTQYEFTPAVAPYLSQQIDTAVLYAARYWDQAALVTTNNLTRGGASGSNPFVEDGIVIDLQPSSRYLEGPAVGDPNMFTSEVAPTPAVLQYYTPPVNP